MHAAVLSYLGITDFDFQSNTGHPCYYLKVFFSSPGTTEGNIYFDNSVTVSTIKHTLGSTCIFIANG